MSKHKCLNRYGGDGARGGSFFDISSDHSEQGTAYLRVGHSCVIIHDAEIPVTWLAELVAIAKDHRGGIAGFLEEHAWSGESYALMCDPATPTKVKSQ